MARGASPSGGGALSRRVSWALCSPFNPLAEAGPHDGHPTKTGSWPPAVALARPGRLLRQAIVEWGRDDTGRTCVSASASPPRGWGERDVASGTVAHSIPCRK